MATREASIWRSVIQAHSIAFKPYSPNATTRPSSLASAAAAHLLSVLHFLGHQHRLFSFP